MKLAFIYPNPSKDFINVRYGAHLKNVSIEIFDISGKKIFHKNLKNPISKIDIQNLKSGSYVYHILNDNKIFFLTSTMFRHQNNICFDTIKQHFYTTNV